MTALIVMLAWLPHVLPAMSELPQPVNVVLNSHHFNHVLTWEPGPGTPTGVYYRVTVQTERGISWMPVLGCEHVQHPLVCNLTEAFSNPREVYLTQIKALMEAQESREVTVTQRFKPIRDTNLDLPLLTVAPCEEDLCVDLEPPMEHLREIYECLHYTLRIESNNAYGAPILKYTTSLRREFVKDPVSGRQYCVSVRFSDSHVERKSNYSQPVCAVLPGHFNANPWIAGMLCLLAAAVVGAKLVHKGFISMVTYGLKRKPLPSVLTSIHHYEDAVVVPSGRTSFSSLLNIKPTPPSSGEKRSSQTSDESDDESVTENTGGNRGGGYHLRMGTNLLSSSSSSLSSCSAPLSAEPESPSFSSNQTSDVFIPQSELVILTETQSNAGSIGPESTRTTSHSDSPPISNHRSDPCPADTDSLTVGRIQPKEERKVVGEEDSLDVNLLSLTFSRPGEEEEEEEEPESFSVSEVFNTIPTLPSQTRDTQEVAIETVSCPVDEEEEEEEEHSGYIGRP